MVCGGSVGPAVVVGPSVGGCPSPPTLSGEQREIDVVVIPPEAHRPRKLNSKLLPVKELSQSTGVNFHFLLFPSITSGFAAQIVWPSTKPKTS